MMAVNRSPATSQSIALSRQLEQVSKSQLQNDLRQFEGDQNIQDRSPEVCTSEPSSPNVDSKCFAAGSGVS